MRLGFNTVYLSSQQGICGGVFVAINGEANKELEMKTSTTAAQGGVPEDGNPAEQIRLHIDAGFAGVEKARQMQQVGSREAAAEAVEAVKRIIVRVRALLPSASFTEAQLGVVNKKIQALKDAAERMGGAPK